ncbi:hypothetical protein B7P43_G08455 [Cryptotermes secundus]|uniref:Uncharacterized protein n=1 Tax=Cryptotermes secundus TaxID=105785 RepID=A0A2J7PZN2_9NEOP|nr:hypothetical protein B7P43_G08455 [Cryptotermes secundus]
MELWMTEHRSFVFETFIQTRSSVVLTQCRFHTHFNVGQHGAILSRNTILKWVKSFRTTGSVRPGTTRGELQKTSKEFDKLWRPAHVAHALQMSERSVCQILHFDLHYHPYRVMVVQEVLRDDTVLITSDEVHFHLTGSVNKQNFWYWSANNPQELHQRPLHCECERVTVWCRMAQFGIIGPYFFMEGRRTVTVNSQCYMAMLCKFLLPELQRCRIDLTTVWFQQDGATCHTSRESMALLRKHFPGHLISKHGDVEWPP